MSDSVGVSDSTRKKGGAWWRVDDCFLKGFPLRGRASLRHLKWCGHWPEWGLLEKVARQGY